MTNAAQIRPVKPRVTSFDVSRGIAITFMVIGHSVTAVENTILGVSPFWTTFNEVFHTIRMPLFFFLAGVFLVSTLKKLGYRNWLVDKAQYLLYPWLVWSLIRGLLEVGLYEIGIGSPMSLGEMVYGIVWDPRIWYLPALFISFAVVGGGYAASRGWKWWPLVMLGALAALVVLTYLPWWPPMLHVHPFSLYMLAGVVLAPLAIQTAGLSRGKAATVAAGALFVFGVVVGYLLPTGLLLDNSSLAFIVCAVLGVVGFLALGRVLDGLLVGRGLERLGRWSLVIYVVHAIPVSLARTLLMKVGIDDYTVLVLIPAAFGIAVPALLGWLNDRGHLRWLITMPGYRRSAVTTRLP